MHDYCIFLINTGAKQYLPVYEYHFLFHNFFHRLQWKQASFKLYWTYTFLFFFHIHFLTKQEKVNLKIPSVSSVTSSLNLFGGPWHSACQLTWQNDSALAEVLGCLLVGLRHRKDSPDEWLSEGSFVDQDN